MSDVLSVTIAVFIVSPLNVKRENVKREIQSHALGLHASYFTFYSIEIMN